MTKRTICKTATILFGLLAIALYAIPDITNGQVFAGQLARAALGLLSIIFGTLWVDYQKRQEALSAQPGWPIWVRRLLFSSSLFLSVLAANAQTNWTQQELIPPSSRIFDVAYGAGR
jgi:hypothetical protein